MLIDHECRKSHHFISDKSTDTKSASCALQCLIQRRIRQTQTKILVAAFFGVLNAEIGKERMIEEFVEGNSFQFHAGDCESLLPAHAHRR